MFKLMNIKSLKSFFTHGRKNGKRITEPTARKKLILYYLVTSLIPINVIDGFVTNKYHRPFIVNLL